MPISILEFDSDIKFLQRLLMAGPGAMKLLVGQADGSMALRTLLATGAITLTEDSGAETLTLDAPGLSTPKASDTVSGTVKTDVADADPVVYLKASVDTLLAGKAASATTLAGYGITDAYTKSEVDTAIADVESDVTALDAAAVKDGDTAGGDLSGTYPNPSVAKVDGIAVDNHTTAPTAGQALVYDGTKYSPGTVSGGSAGSIIFGLQFEWGDGSAQIVSGATAGIRIPMNCQILKSVCWTESGSNISAQIEVERSAATNPPSFSSMVGAGVKPSLTTEQLREDVDLSDWTSTTCSAGDLVRARITSISGTCQALRMQLHIRANTAGVDQGLQFGFGDKTYIVAANAVDGCRVPWDGTITHVICWTEDGANRSATFDVLRSAAAGPPTYSSMVGGGVKPTLSAAQYSDDTDLTDWTSVAVTAGDLIQVKTATVDGVATSLRCQLHMTRS